MKLNELTWKEVEGYLQDRDEIIIPAGTCEQHSLHLPLGTDTFIIEYFADFLSAKTGIIVAPTFNYGVNLPCDRYYPGTCNITSQILRKTLTSLVEWWKLQGFRKFFVITAHGDPYHLEALKGRAEDGLFLLEVYSVSMNDILTKQETVKHSCEAETSLMLYIFRDMVREGSIEDYDMEYEDFREYLEHRKDKPPEGSPGCLGYPSAASYEKGKELVNRMKDNALKWILERITGKDFN